MWLIILPTPKNFIYGNTIIRSKPLIKKFLQAASLTNFSHFIISFSFRPLLPASAHNLCINSLKESIQLHISSNETCIVIAAYLLSPTELLESDKTHITLRLNHQDATFIMWRVQLLAVLHERNFFILTTCVLIIAKVLIYPFL